MSFMSLNVVAASFETHIYDQDPKGNLKKLTNLNKKKGKATLFWWNVAWGKYNTSGSIDLNLLALATSALSPDIIAMGEYKPSVLKESTLKSLNRMYQYSAFLPYIPTDSVGVAIFSKYPFKESGAFPLDWSPIRATSRETESYRQDWLKIDPDWVKYWDRSFAYYSVFLPGTVLNVVPVHLCSPWQSVHKKLGNWKTFRTIMAAHDNPLLHQLERMQAILKQDFGNDMNKEAMILMGDFNVPVSVPIPILGGKPKMYKLLQGPLEDVLDSDDDTFPTKSTQHDQTGIFKDNEVQLDHVFHNKKIKSMRAEVMHFKGSDHYPILMIVD